MLDIRELAHHPMVTRHPWRTLGIAVVAGAVLALLPNRVVRKVVKSAALAFARDAAATFVIGTYSGSGTDASHRFS